MRHLVSRLSVQARFRSRAVRGSLATIPDQAEFPHAATTARIGPSSRSPRPRTVRPGDAVTQRSTINPRPVPRQPADSLPVRLTTRTPRAGLLRRMVPSQPLHCCWGCRVQCLVSVIFALHRAVPTGGRAWFLLKATSTGRPIGRCRRHPRFLVKGRRARNK